MDNSLETFLLTVREYLVDGRGKEASDKVKLFINKDEDHKHETEISKEDIKELSSITIQDFQEDDFELANKHSE